MWDDTRLLTLILVFAPLSLLSFGGGQAVIADIQYQSVDVHSWLSDRTFTDLFALSRSAPGPATLIVALIGWQVWGFFGAVVATLAIYVPSSIVVVLATTWWHKAKDSPWRDAIERGLAPIALGLIFAGVAAVVRAAHMDAMALAVSAIAATLLYFTRVSAYWLILAVAALYTGLLFV